MKKNRIKYLIVFIFSLLFVYLHGGIVPWSFFYFILVLPLVSLLNLYISYKTFSFHEQTNETTFIKGDSIKYTCKVIVEHFLPLLYMNLYIQTPITFITNRVDKKEIFLYSKKAQNFTYRIECKYRGKYQMGLQMVEFIDILSLFKLTYFPKILNKVTIFPKIKKIIEPITKNVALSQQQLSYINKSKGDEATINIRNYMYGDSSKLIHWKLSAKLDELMIKERENVFDRQVILAIDLKKLDIPTREAIIYEDILIEEIIATSYYFIKNSIPIDVIFYYEGIQSIHANSIVDFYSLYKTLAEVSFSAQSTLQSVLFNSLNSMEKVNTMYVYCLELNSNIVDNITKLHSMGKQLITKYCLSKSNAHTYLEKNGISNNKIEVLKEKEYLYYEK